MACMGIKLPCLWQSSGAGYRWASLRSDASWWQATAQVRGSRCPHDVLMQNTPLNVTCHMLSRTSSCLKDRWLHALRTHHAQHYCHYWREWSLADNEALLSEGTADDRAHSSL